MFTRNWFQIDLIRKLLTKPLWNQSWTDPQLNLLFYTLLTDVSVDILTAIRLISGPKYLGRHIDQYIGRDISQVLGDNRPIYRPICWLTYLAQYISRVSVDMLTDISVKHRSIYQPTIGRYVDRYISQGVNKIHMIPIWYRHEEANSCHFAWPYSWPVYVKKGHLILSSIQGKIFFSFFDRASLLQWNFERFWKATARVFHMSNWWKQLILQH